MSKTELLCNDIVESVIIKLSLAKRRVSRGNFGSRSFETKYCAGKQFFCYVICIIKYHCSISTCIILVTINVPLWTKMFAQIRTTRILSDMFKYTTARLSRCRDLLLSKKPWSVTESEVNAGWKLDRSELTTMTRLRLESLGRWWWVFSPLGCCRTPLGTSTSRTTEGVFGQRCRSIDVPKRTLMKIEHVSSIYADEMTSVWALVFTTC
jgi:hypothetical protein